jgi:hypothetical protein
MAKILTEFDAFPREKEFVGSMLIAYGEIEFALFSMVDAVLDTQGNAVEIFFRIRGEGARIEVSDAIIRPFLEKAGLGPKWSNAIAPIRLCKKIRNQYAHCHWILVQDKLNFINFDDSVEAGKNGKPIFMRLVNHELLERQFVYFRYALDWLYYLAAEYRMRCGKIESHEHKEPKSIAAPPLHIRTKTDGRRQDVDGRDEPGHDG